MRKKLLHGITFLIFFSLVINPLRAAADFMMARTVKPVAVQENQFIPSVKPLLNFKLHETPKPLQPFFREKFFPKEAVYFLPGIGLDAKTGVPYDHLRIRGESGEIKEVGKYTAPSKLSLSIPFFLNVILEHPDYANVPMKPEQAEEILGRCLQSMRVYSEKNPEQKGFFPWLEIRPNGTLATSQARIPSLDNGELTWSLVAVVVAFETSQKPSQQKLAFDAQKILDLQNYSHFYDSNKELLFGEVLTEIKTDKWKGDKNYHLNDMFEGSLAVLWGVLNRQIPEAAWDNLDISTVDYDTSYGEKVTTLEGFRGSFHECWALAYLPLMESSLAPLYRNFLQVQADYAKTHQLPGFFATAYDAQNIYRQMGVPEIASQPVERSDVAIPYATAMAMLISPEKGGIWLKHLYQQKGLVNPFLGAVESMDENRRAEIMTADGKGMSLLAASGGITSILKHYLQTHNVPGTKISMEKKMKQLVNRKYKQMLKARAGEPLYHPTHTVPLPQRKSA